MYCQVFDYTGTKRLYNVDLIPNCGDDFCDTCGDCLVCYVEDACNGVDGEEHFWVIYEEKQ